jgi:hypothetical protein
MNVERSRSFVVHFVKIDIDRKASCWDILIENIILNTSPVVPTTATRVKVCTQICPLLNFVLGCPFIADTDLL